METQLTATQPCRAVLFDVDDTLYAVADLIRQSWVVHAAQLRERGLDASDLTRAYDQFRHLRTTDDALALALAHLGRPVELGQVVHQIARAYTPAVLTAHRGTLEVLTDLRAGGVLTGVVTNGDPGRQRAKLAALGLAALFDVVVVCDGTAMPSKPSSRGFVAALDALGVPARSAVMVGDRPDFDLVPALALGMSAVRVRSGAHAALAAPPGAVDCPDPEHAWDEVRRAAALPPPAA